MSSDRVFFAICLLDVRHAARERGRDGG